MYAKITKTTPLRKEFSRNPDSRIFIKFAFHQKAQPFTSNFSFLSTFRILPTLVLEIIAHNIVPIVYFIKGRSKSRYKQRF